MSGSSSSAHGRAVVDPRGEKGKSIPTGLESRPPGGATMMAIARRAIPAPLRRAARAALQELRLRAALRRLHRLPVGTAPSAGVARALQRAWGNEGFAAKDAYPAEVNRHAMRAQGPILECGSGLTTILLTALAGRRGIPVWSLEHMSEWHTRVAKIIDRLGVPAVRVVYVPLQPYGEYDWYAPPFPVMPKDFRLVICDGPPGSTHGGRYGLLPIMRDHLVPGAIVLLDDAYRPAERAALDRWASEIGWRATLHETFAVVTTPPSPFPRRYTAVYHSSR